MAHRQGGPEAQKPDTGRIWCHLRGKPSTMEPQERGWAQGRTPKHPLRRVPRQAPEEHLGAPPPQVRRKLGLSQGAISNENAALAGRRARFQGIGFFKASGGKVGGAQAHTECNKSTGIWA